MNRIAVTLAVFLVVGVLLARNLVAKYYCGPESDLDRQAHAYLRQKAVAANSVAAAYASTEAADSRYAELRTAASDELDRLKGMRQDPLTLGFVDDARRELELADHCHQIRNDPQAKSHCDVQLMTMIGQVGH